MICTGDELVEGRIVDTNGPTLARELFQRGWRPTMVTSVGDDFERLSSLIREGASRAAAIVISGGLGGTRDDLTREALAAAAGVELVHSDDARDRVAAIWERVGRTPPAEPWPESLVPEGATLVRNPKGMAPGLLMAIGASRVLALPGVPHELHAMIDDGALDALGGRIEGRCEVDVILSNIPESVLARKLGELLDRGRNPLVGIGVKESHIALHMRAVAATDAQARRLVDEDIASVRAIVPEHVVSTDGRTLPQVVVAELQHRGQTLAVAESLTGGLIGHWLTELPGVSETLLADVVCYANEAKRDLVGVAEALIAAHGAVSREVAEAMARGVREASGADWGIATTGIAGPTGGSEEKPVGTTWVAVDGPVGSAAEVRVHGGVRGQVKIRAAAHALDLLRRSL